MALIVGELAVELDARTRQFRASINRAQTRLRRFAGAAQRATASVGRGFLRLGGIAGKLTLAIGAVAAAATAFAAISLFRRSIAAARVQEDAIVQLDAALASLGERGAQTSKELQAFASQLQQTTKFGDEEIIAAQARLAAFVKEEGALKGLTAAAVDFAAARGIRIVEAADLIAKSVGSSTNALVRYGISIEGAAGSTERATSAVNAIARVFGGQAQAQALTFTGSITQLGNAFGDTLEEIGFSVTKNEELAALIQAVLIPAFQDFGRFVAENRDQITQFVTAVAVDGIPLIIRAFEFFTRSLAFTARGVRFLVNAFRFIRGVLSTVQFQIVSFINFLRRIPIAIRAVVQNAGALFRAFTAAVTGNFAEAARILTEEVDFTKTSRDLEELAFQTGVAEDQAKGFAAEFVAGTPALDTFIAGVDRAGGKLNLLSLNTKQAIKDTKELRAELAKRGPREPADDVPERTPAQVAAQARLQTISAGLTVQEERKQSVLEMQILAIQKQIGEVGKLDVFGEDRVLREQAILRLQERQVELAARAAAAAGRVGEIQAVVVDRLGDLAGIDPEQAAQLTNQFGMALAAAAGDPMRQAQIAADFASQVSEALAAAAAEGADEAGATFGQGVAGSLGTSLRMVLQGESVSFSEALGDALNRNAQQGLSDAFESSVTFFEGLLGDALDKAGDAIGDLFGAEDGFLSSLLPEGVGKDLGASLGSLASAGLSAGIAAFTRRDEGRAMAANIRSAVTSTAAVRGIVAGPTQIAVAQVDRAISDSFLEPTRLLRIIAENTGRTVEQTSDTGTGSIPTGGTDPATQALANEGPSLV